MTSQFRTLLLFEARKLWRGPVTRLLTLGCLLVVTATTIGGYAAAVRAPDSDTGRKAAAMVATPGWPGYTGLGALSAGVTMLLAAGVVMSWTVGREFTEGTIVGLFAIPPRPDAAAAAKIIATLAWVVVLAVAEAVLLAVGGLALGLGAGGAAACAATLLMSISLLGASALPAMWVASRWRGYLAGIGATLSILVVTNVAAGFGAGRYVPWAIPTLWATSTSDVSTITLVAPVAVAALGAVTTLRAWRRLELGRA